MQPDLHGTAAMCLGPADVLVWPRATICLAAEVSSADDVNALTAWGFDARCVRVRVRMRTARSAVRAYAYEALCVPCRRVGVRESAKSVGTRLASASSPPN